jgi:superfamily II DNA or RNA helicase
VLAPTRELADQVAENVKKYAKHSNLRSLVVFGGIDMKPQTLALKAGVEVLIATPGRLLDHIEAKNAVLNHVEYVVLDEADRMLDIGFLPDLQRILSYLPKTRQTLLFSATFSPEIKKLANSYLQDPVLVEVARPNATATNVEQRFFSVTDDDKRAVVRQLLKSRELSQALIFVNSKLGCARLARSFERDGLRTQALHGDKSQDERLKALAAFKAGEVDLLVATDVAARGLDITDLPAVFNFDVPFHAEDYVHRIGRTGRAGASGLAVTLVTRDDTRMVSTSKGSSRRRSSWSPSRSKTNVHAGRRAAATMTTPIVMPFPPSWPICRPCPRRFWLRRRQNDHAARRHRATRFSTSPMSPAARVRRPGNRRPSPAPRHPPHADFRPTSAPRRRWPCCWAAANSARAGAAWRLRGGCSAGQQGKHGRHAVGHLHPSLAPVGHAVGACPAAGQGQATTHTQPCGRCQGVQQGANTAALR